LTENVIPFLESIPLSARIVNQIKETLKKPIKDLTLVKEKCMVVGAGKIKFKLYGINSLKEKRRIIKSIIQRIKNKFNISIAETKYNDSHLWSQIGFSIIGNNSRVVNSKMDKVLNLADEIGLAQITDTQIEIIHL